MRDSLETLAVFALGLLLWCWLVDWRYRLAEYLAKRYPPTADDRVGEILYGKLRWWFLERHRIGGK